MIANSKATKISANPARPPRIPPTSTGTTGPSPDAAPVGDAVIVDPLTVAVFPGPAPAPPSVTSTTVDSDDWDEVVLVEVVLAEVLVKALVEVPVKALVEVLVDVAEPDKRDERLDVGKAPPDVGTGVGEAITITVPLEVVVERLHEVLMLTVEFCTGMMGVDMKEVMVGREGAAVAEKLLLLLLMPLAPVKVLKPLLLMKLLPTSLGLTPTLLGRGFTLAPKNGVDSEAGCESAGEGGGVELKII